MLNKSLQFLSEHKEVAFATCGGNLPKLRMFQVMKQDGNVLYFATSAKKTVYRELKENPNVELLAYADNISVRCSGMVNFYVDDDQSVGYTIIMMFSRVSTIATTSWNTSVSLSLTSTISTSVQRPLSTSIST